MVVVQKNLEEQTEVMTIAQSLAKQDKSWLKLNWSDELFGYCQRLNL